MVYVEQPDWWDDPVSVTVNMPPWYWQYTEPTITDITEVDGVEVDLNLYTINGTKTIFDITTLCEQMYSSGADIDRLCTLVYFTKYYKAEEQTIDFTQIYSI